MRRTSGDIHPVSPIRSVTGLVVLKVVFGVVLLGGIAALSVAPEAVVRAVPYPTVALGVSVLVGGVIAASISIRHVRS